MAISSAGPLICTEAMLRGLLHREASALSAGRDMPLDLRALLDELGLGLVSELRSGSRPAHGCLRQKDGAWDVVVNATTTPGRQRFTIAHEIGHFLIEARVGFRPGTTTEYWMLEDVCQAFAADLLSPAPLVAASISPCPAAPGGLFEPLARLMAATELSLEGTARRIVENIDGPTAFAALELPSEGSKGGGAVQGSVGWFHTNRPWIKAGRGQAIRAGHALWPVLTRASELPVGARTAFTSDDGHVIGLERRRLTFGLAAIYLAA